MNYSCLVFQFLNGKILSTKMQMMEIIYGLYESKWTVINIPYTSDYMIDTYGGLYYAKICIDNEDDVLNHYNIGD